MDFEIKTDGGGEVMICADIPEDLLGLQKLPAHCFTLMGDWGKSRFLHYRGSGFTVSFNDYLVNKDTILLARSSTAILELNISLGFPILGTWDGIRQPVLQKHQFSLSYTPHVKTRASFLAGKRYNSFDIHFEKPFLQDLAKDFPVLAEFMERVEKGTEPAELSQREFFCTQEMLAAIQFISNNAYSIRAQPRLVRYKVEEILIAALEIAEELSPARDVKLFPHEIEALQRIKLHIELNLDAMPSIIELSRMSALNQDKLKKGFRKLFGTSPYDYHIRLKMQEAKRLLLETNKPVWEIAYEVGYHKDSAFCIAFKKLVGCQPLYFRKHGRKV